MLRFVVDDHIPFLKGVLEPYAQVIYAAGGRISRKLARQADGLIIRTRTHCNEGLLKDTPVRFIATATIGFDHIDTNYCRENSIVWNHAPGCNAGSVAQYMASALVRLADKHDFNLAGKTLGIIGVGHVGSRVARLASSLGMNMLLNDPPRARQEPKGDFVSLEEIQKTSDIITFHVPLTYEGDDGTFHMADKTFFDNLKLKPIIINTSRGPVIDTSSVMNAMTDNRIAGYVADVWENEPECNHEWLEMAEIATPHIAGYSVEGKANGTAACVRATSRYFGLGLDDWYPSGLPAPEFPVIQINAEGKNDNETLSEAVLHTYDILKDDAAFRADPSRFEDLRNFYPARRECEAFTVNISPASPNLELKLKSLGFNLPGTKH